MHTLMDRSVAQPLVELTALNGQTLYVAGLQALRAGDGAGASDLLIAALRHQPAHPGMRRNLVRALLASERYQQLLVQAGNALADAPDDAELHFAHGTALNALGQHAAACTAFGRALSLQPDHAPSWLNMGNAAIDLDDLTSAETCYRTAVRLDPSLPEVHASLGYILTRLGQPTEAIAACEAAIRLRPDLAQAHWNLAVAALLAGDLRRGFTAYEWRKRHTRFRKDFPDLPGPMWDGSDPTGQTILVRAEQGFGDAIQFARYLPMIRDAGGSPVLSCAPALVPLMRSMHGVRAVASFENVPPYDAWIDQMSLPKIFATDLDTIPAADFYLAADRTRIEAWDARLPSGGRIGLAFAGNPNHTGDRRRSIPPALLARWRSDRRESFINLQHGPSAASLGLTDLTPWLTDYAETAALIANLDLVITVDTSVAHLAGALGKPVWILLPHAPDWRWLLGRSDTPWYRSARLFRQPTPDDWDSVLAQVAHALDQANQ